MKRTETFNALAVALLSLCTLAAVPVQSASNSQHPALCRINSGCSGICVDASGIVVTAKHCIERPGQIVEVRFSGGQSHSGTVVHVATNSDLAVVRVDARESLPAAPVAMQAPAVGDAVFSEGYPAGQHARMEGRVTFVGERSFEPQRPFPMPFSRIDGRARTRVIETSHRIQRGTSGGPLFNRDGELVGIASMVPASERDVRSFWMHTSDVRAAVAAAGGNLARPLPETSPEKPVLWVVVTAGCKPCVLFKSDYGHGGPPENPELRRRLDARFKVQFIDWNDAEALADRYEIEFLPAFVDTSADRLVEGYEGADALLAELVPAKFERRSETQAEPVPELGKAAPPRSPAAAAAPLSPQPDPLSTPQTPPPEPPEVPAAKPDIDYATLTVIGVVRKEFTGAKGLLAGYAERKWKGPAERKLKEKLGGLAEVCGVFERTEPETYTAVMQAAGLSDRVVNVVVLVEQQELPGLVDAIVERVREGLKEYKEKLLEDAPIVVIFERSDAEHFAAVHSALQGSDAAGGGSEEEPEDRGFWLSILAALGIGGELWKKLPIIRRFHRET